jgi:hypothetical protein
MAVSADGICDLGERWARETGGCPSKSLAGLGIHGV